MYILCAYLDDAQYVFRSDCSLMSPSLLSGNNTRKGTWPTSPHPAIKLVSNIYLIDKRRRKRTQARSKGEDEVGKRGSSDSGRGRGSVYGEVAVEGDGSAAVI